MRISSRLTVLLAAVAFVGWCVAFIHRTSFIAIDGHRAYALFDDAMISMRYAWNLAHGSGPVWNLGEPVEGYTNPLMVLLMAVPAALLSKPAAVLAVQLLGIPTLLAIGAVGVALYRELAPRNEHGGRRIPEAVVFLATAAYYPLAYFSLMGMETGLLGMLVVLQVWLAVRQVQAPSTGSGLLLGAAAALAYLTRPDSVLLSGAVLAFAALVARSRGQGRAWWRPVLMATLLLAGVIVLHRLWALAYYGSVVPNTYTLKLGGIPLGTRLANGGRYVYRYIVQVWPVLALATLEVFLDARPIKLLMGALVAAALGYQVWIGGEPWPYWRLLAPAWPMLALLALSNCQALLQAIERSSVGPSFLRRRPLIGAGAVVPTVGSVVVATLLLVANDPFKKEIAGLEPVYQVEENQRNVNDAIAVLEVTTPEASVGSIWAGSIPYYSGRYAVDFLGKSDARIAALPPDLSGEIAWGGLSTVPGHNKYDLDYSIRTLRPTYVQSLAYGQDDLSELAESLYVVAYVRFPRGTVPLYLLRDSPHVDWTRVFLP